MNEPFKSYSKYIRKTFGERVQKISVDAGLTCPNRDGSKGRGGCTYCNNDTFNPFYTSKKKSITQQLNEGVAFFAPKYKTQKYIAYFQAYTNTYAEVDELKVFYQEALMHPQVIGLSISTRPDAINNDVVDLLSEIARNFYITVELGIESTLNKSLDRLNRCHTYEETVCAYNMLEGRNIYLGGHLIIGIQGETFQDYMIHAQNVSKLPINFLKLHQLQVIKGTKMAKEFTTNPDSFNLITVDEYVATVCEFIKYVRPDIIFERFSSESPRELLLAPNWGGLKNFAITDKIRNKLIQEKSYQGQLYI